MEVRQMTFTKLPVVAALVSALALTACQAPVPGQTNDNAQQSALIGAGIGAVLGAATGSDSEERFRNAAIGAAAGSVLGGVAGTNLDRQEAELRNELGAGVGIVNTGSQLIVTMPQDILFATDSATLTATLQGDLQDVAASLNRYPDTTVNVVGHTDNTGTAAYNLDLSQRRAQSVASVLISAGVAPQRVRVTGLGENQPVASNQTPEGRALNRRVEMIITPNQ